LPPPEGPTSAVTLPGSATKAHAVEHRLVRPIGEIDVAQFDPRLGQFQLRLVVIGWFGGRTVDDFQQLARPDQVAVQFDVEPRQPLGRLIGEQERGQERKNCPGVAPIATTR
jgi:hypothetical protein